MYRDLPVEFFDRYSYEQSTGRIRSKRTGRYGDTEVNSFGYRRASWNRGSRGKLSTMAHIVVWCLHHGPVPDGMVIDHIDGDKLNNRVENLRLVTAYENMQNRRHLGYTYIPAERRYKVSLKRHGKLVYFGYFKTPEAARAAYLTAKAKYHEAASPHTLK